MLRTVRATRYVTPLREGGSIPAIVEGDDDGLYVAKFRGAAQGRKALIAELVAGEIGRLLGLPIPDIVYIEFDPALSRNEPDIEIRELLDASGGLNIGLDFLPGALGFDVAAARAFPADLAALTVWFDAFVTNVDRTARNPNIIMWHREPWLIDHGASLYFHHSWDGYLEKSRSPFPMVRQHVLLARASSLSDVDAFCHERLTDERLAEIVGMIPDDWVEGEPGFAGPHEARSAYLAYLRSRLESSAVFVEEAEDARGGL